MRIAPFSFKEFDAAVISGPKARGGMQPLLPGGRQREEVPPPPPPPPSYSEEELASAKQEAYKNGFESGIQEGRALAQNEQADIDRELLKCAEQFVVSLTPLLHDYKEFVLQMREDMPRVAQTIAKKVAGDALSENAQLIVENVALNCCQTMINEPKLVITVHKSLAATLETKLKDMATRVQSAGDIIVTPDDQMVAGDCRIEWQHGQIERSTEQLWAQVDRVIADMVASAKHTTDNHIDTLQNDVSNPSNEITPKE